MSGNIIHLHANQHDVAPFLGQFHFMGSTLLKMSFFLLVLLICSRT